MPYARPSSAVALVSPVMACLVAVYASERGRGAWAEIEPLLMIRPPGGVLPPHDPERLPRTQERPGQVEVDHRLPLAERDLVQLPRRTAHPGVVEQQVQPPVPLDGRREQGAYGLLVGDVGRHRIQGEVRVRGGHLPQRGLPASGDHHRPAVLAEGDAPPPRRSRCLRRSPPQPAPPPIPPPTASRHDVAMQIAIVGSGVVARFLGQAFAAAGHDVTLGTRDPEQTRAREEWAGVEPAAGGLRRPGRRGLRQRHQGRRLAGRVAGRRPGAGREGGDRHLQPARPQSRVPAVVVRLQHRLAGRAAAAGPAAGPAGQDVQHHGPRGDGRPGSS